MLELLAILPWAVFTVAAPFVLRRRPRLDRYPPPADHGADMPLVSIIVPARDEAENIGPCVVALLDTDYPRTEILVVNDRSADGTGEVARALAERGHGAVRVVDGDPLPEGWIGKSWACWQGYGAARGELLLFTDADTRHSSELLGHAVGALQAERADLVSLLPRQRMHGFWEQLILPHIGLTIRLRFANLRRVNRSRSPRDAIANGQFVLVRRQAYEAVGGHAAVREEIVEDLRLAQRFVAAGRRIFMAHAEPLMETRMYRSLRAIVEGWTKNLATGARQSVPAWLRPAVPWLIAAGLIGFWVVPPFVLIGALFAGAAGLVAWGAAVTALSLAFWLGYHLRAKTAPAQALVYPLGAVAAAWLFMRSARRGPNVEWRRRRYGADRRAAAD